MQFMCTAVHVINIALIDAGTLTYIIIFKTFMKKNFVCKKTGQQSLGNNKTFNEFLL